MFEPKPEITEIDLKKNYHFMYENFVIATQNESYLLLEKKDEIISALKFDSIVIKYGGPNDEGRGAHPLTKHGSLLYGLYEVKNSPWLKEQMVGNRTHPRHSDSLFKNRKHYIACFKDVMFEVTCKSYEEVELTQKEVLELIENEIINLTE